MYDAIVVGARCAGAPVSMLLAQRGYRVLLVDKAHFPSDTCSTAFLRTGAVMRLKEWGLFDRLVAAGTPCYESGHANVLGMRMPMQFPPGYPSMAPRRTVLDAILLDAARDAGVEVREGYTVRGLVRDGDRVTGIRGQERHTPPSEERAPIVIGADGANSFVARSVGAPMYDVHHATSCGAYSYWSGITSDGSELFLGHGLAGFVFPSNDGLTCLGVEFNIAGWPDFRANAEAGFASRFTAIAPGFADQFAAARREDRLWAMSGRDSFYRHPYGPGWALVGDAGFLKDPIFGTGIDDAFRDAELLAAAIDDGFSGRQPLDVALARYHRARDEDSHEMYQLICDASQMGQLDPALLIRLGALQSAGAPA
jgi:flavin-dependent dehydrogenase